MKTQDCEEVNEDDLDFYELFTPVGESVGKNTKI
jgi:hypothetical protein